MIYDTRSIQQCFCTPADWDRASCVYDVLLMQSAAQNIALRRHLESTCVCVHANMHGAQLSQVGTNICMGSPCISQSFRSTFHYSSELLFWEVLRMRVLIQFTICERNSGVKADPVVLKLKQRLLMREKILRTDYDQSAALVVTFSVLFNIFLNMKTKVIRGFPPVGKDRLMFIMCLPYCLFTSGGLFSCYPCLNC